MSSLIPTLLKAQTSPQSSLATKMTLRDCTLFMQIPKELISDPPTFTDTCSLSTEGTAVEAIDLESPKHSRGIRIVIADLDEKSEKNRGEYWKSLEDALNSGGYYLGKGKLDVKAEDCDLSDNVWTSDQVKWNGFTEE